MLCAIYKSSKKDETYLFVERRDDFSRVPQALLNTFGTPLFVMVLLLKEGRELALADREKVMENLSQQGFYLQMPPPKENLLKQHRALQKENNVCVLSCY